MESVDGAATGGQVAAFAHGFGQRDQVVFVGVGGQRACVPDKLPATRRRDPAGVADAEVPGVRLTGNGQRADDGGGVRVHEGQRRNRVVRTPWPAAATRNVHDREVIVRKRL